MKGFYFTIKNDIMEKQEKYVIVIKVKEDFGTWSKVISFTIGSIAGFLLFYYFNSSLIIY